MLLEFSSLLKHQVKNNYCHAKFSNRLPENLLMDSKNILCLSNGDWLRLKASYKQLEINFDWELLSRNNNRTCTNQSGNWFCTFCYTNDSIEEKAMANYIPDNYLGIQFETGQLIGTMFQLIQRLSRKFDILIKSRPNLKYQRMSLVVGNSNCKRS